MRLSIPSGSVRVGNVEVHGTFHVVELDAGYQNRIEESDSFANDRTCQKSVSFSQETLHKIENQLAVVVPCMNEQSYLLEGVLRGVPNACLIILVSSSDGNDVDTFQMECDMLRRICSENNRSGVIVHQQDEGVAEAFVAAGMSELVERIQSPQSRSKTMMRIRKGKGEAMMIGVALAKLAGKQMVGFVDADNWCSGSVQEYCKAFAAGLHYASRYMGLVKHSPSLLPIPATSAPHAMVRIKWNSKPKIKNGRLVRQNSGRCSLVVNEWLNSLLKTLAKDKLDGVEIQTGNAGEHAMSIDLAMQLRFASGYSVEPYQFVDIFEQFESHPPLATQNSTSVQAHQTKSTNTTFLPAECATGSLNPPQESLSLPRVRIIQIETCNPHIHNFNRRDEHIRDMQIQALSTIYHSRLASKPFKDKLGSFIKNTLSGDLDQHGRPAKCLVYPALAIIDLRILRSRLKAQARTLQVFGGPEMRLL